MRRKGVAFSCSQASEVRGSVVRRRTSRGIQKTLLMGPAHDPVRWSEGERIVHSVYEEVHPIVAELEVQTVPLEDTSRITAVKCIDKYSRIIF